MQPCATLNPVLYYAQRKKFIGDPYSLNAPTWYPHLCMVCTTVQQHNASGI